MVVDERCKNKQASQVLIPAVLSNTHLNQCTDRSISSQAPYSFLNPQYRLLSTVKGITGDSVALH